MDFDYGIITLTEVMRSNSIPYMLNDKDVGRAMHLGRIKWFILNGWTDPIDIEAGNSIWPIIDGNHRLAAGFLTNKKRILSNVFGIGADEFISGAEVLCYQ